MNPWQYQYRRNPQALYNTLRQHGPLYRTTGPMTGNSVWWVVGYDVAQAILRDDARFGKNHDRLPPHIAGLYAGTPDDSPFQMMNNNMLFIDPPDHTRLRSMVHKVFTPRRVENLRERVEVISAEFLAQLPDDGFDLINDYAVAVPITVIAELLGIPTDERTQFRQWTQDLLFGESMARATQTGLEFMMYFHNLFDARRENPTDDLLSDLVAVEQDGQHLDQLELMGMVFLLLTAGHETTVNLIGNGMLALMQRPDVYADLVANLDLLPAAVEEMLRFNGPVECATTRWAFEDVTFGDTTIQHGDAVLVSLIGANHDPAMFPNPEVFDIRRTPNKHLAFGHGIHYCLGAPLARLEGTVALRHLLERFPTLTLAVDEDDLQWNDSTLLHGVKSMPVRAGG